MYMQCNNGWVIMVNHVKNPNIADVIATLIKMTFYTCWLSVFYVCFHFCTYQDEAYEISIHIKYVEDEIFSSCIT